MKRTSGDGRPVGSSGRFLGRAISAKTSAVVERGPVAELAVAIVTPGPEGAVRLEGDRVIVSRGNGVPVGCTGHFLGGSGRVDRGPVSENTIIMILSPAPDGVSQRPNNRSHRRRDGR